MPDTKTGRERKGLNKEAQLERRLARQEVRTMGGDDDEPSRFDDVESELLSDLEDVSDVDY